MSLFADTIEAYLLEERAFGRLRSQHSINAYRPVLLTHAEDADGLGPADTTREHVKVTLARWRERSQARNHSALISFYDYCIYEGIRPDNPARAVRRTRYPRKTIYRLTQTEILALMEEARSVTERRLVYVGLLTGARVGELGALQARHFQRSGWVQFTADISKGEVERWVPVLPELEPIVSEIAELPSLGSYILPGHSARKGERRSPQPMGRERLRRVLKEVARRAGVSDVITPHSLRHAYADHVVRHASVFVAQAVLGHKDIGTTTGYIGVPRLDEIAANLEDFRYRKNATPLVRPVAQDRPALRLAQ